MPLRITIESPSIPTRVFDFPSTHPVVTVGRHPSCDICFPPEMTEISRHHVAFERKFARYRLSLSSGGSAWIDGEEAFEGDELPMAARVTLGEPDGPTLRVETLEMDGLPPTRRHVAHAGAARMAAVSARHGGKMARMLLAMLSVVVVLGVALGLILFQKDERLASRLRAAQPSVYLVAAKDERGVTPFATAFVVAEGVLVTSAHVGEIFQQMESGPTLVVRASGAPARDVTVARVIEHPQYREFEAAWRSYGPISAGAAGMNRSIAGAGGYDVALLVVSAEDAKHLGPPLPLASDPTLQSLHPGDAVGYLGFPIESAALGGVNLEDPEAQLQVGHLTALTDFFLVKSGNENRQLLQHSLPVQGGASGSPLLDEDGRVVGVVSGGNLVEIDAQGTRVPTGVGVNFAQRIDLVRELLNGEAKKQGGLRAAYWQDSLKHYQSEIDMTLTGWAEAYGVHPPPPPMEERQGKIAQDREHSMPAFVEKFHLTKPGRYLFLATAPERVNIDMMLVQKFARGTKTVGIDSAPDHFPGVEFLGKAESDLEVVIPGPVGAQVTLRLYWLPL